MSLRQKTTLASVIMIGGGILGFAGSYIHVALAAVGIVILFAGVFLDFRWYRCPHCGASLGRNAIPRFCPSCGKPIDPDAKP